MKKHFNYYSSCQFYLILLVLLFLSSHALQLLPPSLLYLLPSYPPPLCGHPPILVVAPDVITANIYCWRFHMESQYLTDGARPFYHILTFLLNSPTFLAALFVWLVWGLEGTYQPFFTVCCRNRGGPQSLFLNMTDETKGDSEGAVRMRQKLETFVSTGLVSGLWPKNFGPSSFACNLRSNFEPFSEQP